MLLPLWHPLRLAHEAALLDNISDGRLILGVSVGHPFLMSRYGIPPHEMSSRMDEVLLVLKKFWNGADEHRGEHFTVSGRVYPAPVQDGGPPLWIGGNIDRSIERAAASGDGWYGATEYHFAIIKRRAQQFRKLVSQRHGDASAKTVCINRLTMLAETDEQAKKEGKAYLDPLLNFYRSIDHLKDQDGVSLDPVKDFIRLIGEEFCLVGSPESCLLRIKKYCNEAGVNHFNFRVRFSDMPLELTRRTITLLGEEVLPALGNA
jgi:alkanesulfonate monooxygenase SsuD/methylene tetrahydromethanopterin reductase-like flavin-dependent oxidoreductase (luciferase family)